MCRHSCIVFIDFMLKGKSLPVYKNLFPRNDYERNDKTILNIFNNYKDEKIYGVFVVSIENLKKLKYYPS